MDANPYAIKQILSLERRYLIPTFQRDYEWTREGQWDLLFQDLEDAARRLGDARQQAEVTGEGSMAEKRVAPHFLGAVVLEQLASAAGGLDRRSVIDGQQRLTTIQLLLRGLLDVLEELDSPRTRQVRRLLRNPEDVVSDADERHKLWPRRRDREAWREAMDDTAATNSTHAYSKARSFFSESARASIEENGDPNEAASLLVDAALDLFKLVVIDLEDNDDAQVIFEVLNGRQTALSAADLVKNLLFLRAELADEEELETLYEQHWAHFDDPWWKKEVGRGHAARRHSDQLLAAWLTVASGEEASPGRLYGQIRRYLDSSQAKVSNVLAEISRLAEHYRVIQGSVSEEEPRVDEAYRRLRLLGVTTALPLLLWLRSQRGEHLTEADHKACVVAVESFVIRRAMIGAQTRGYYPVFAAALEAAKDSEGTAVAPAVANALAHAVSSRGWPSDDDVIEAFRTRRFYGVDSQQRIRMILSAIDAEMRRNNPRSEEVVVNYDALTIEHVMPKAWRTNWQVAVEGAAERELAEQRRDRYIDRIGNLTLVTSSLNPSLSNGAWSGKRVELGRHSSLELNSVLVRREGWDEDVIKERGNELARVACEVWPRIEE